MDIPILKDVIIIFGLSIVVLLLFHRLHIPSIVGFILTGILCGPHGLGVISDIHAVESLSEIGIVFLLFTIGMELSFKKIIQFKRYFVLGGALQVALSTLGGVIAGYVVGRPTGEAVFLGFLLAMSSTAIVLRILEERNETHSPQGQMVLGILIFQDVLAVPLMLMIPALSGAEANMGSFFLWLILKAALLLTVVFICAEKIVPKLLYLITKTRSRELFLMTVLMICFSVAFLASEMGLSFSIGAFLAGLIVSESEYSTEAIGDVLPIQDIFTSFFFVSIGMLLDLSFVFYQPIVILLCALGVIIMKFFAASITGLIVGMPLRAAVIGGLAISQIGEFAFVLVKPGIEYGLATPYYYQLFLAVALFTMTLAPLLISFSPRIAQQMMRMPISPKLKMGLNPIKTTKEHDLKDHVIIAGYGVSGRNLAHSLREAKIPYVILELNPDTVRVEKQKNEPIYFGDASHPKVLQHLNITEAKGVAVLINDPQAAIHIVNTVRSLNSQVYVVVRVRYLRELEFMYKLGADDVIPDEFGASLEIFTRVLRQFNVEHEDIEKYVASMRFEGYDMIRHLYKEPSKFSNIAIEEMKIETFEIHPNAYLAGITIAESGLRKKYGVTVLMIKRELENITHIGPETLLRANDKLVVIGKEENLINVLNIFKSKDSHEASPLNHPA